MSTSSQTKCVSSVPCETGVRDPCPVRRNTSVQSCKDCPGIRREDGEAIRRTLRVLTMISLRIASDAREVETVEKTCPRKSFSPRTRIVCAVRSVDLETMYSQRAHFQCRVRGLRGDDVHAERCPRDGRDQAPLRSVLGSHVVDFSFF